MEKYSFVGSDVKYYVDKGCGKYNVVRVGKYNVVEVGENTIL